MPNRRIPGPRRRQPQPARAKTRNVDALTTLRAMQRRQSRKTAKTLLGEIRALERAYRREGDG